MYETADMDLRWNDAKSKADKDVAIFRARTPEGYYSLGEIAVPTHDKPRIAFMVKMEKIKLTRRVPNFAAYYKVAGLLA